MPGWQLRFGPSSVLLSCQRPPQVFPAIKQRITWFGVSVLTARRCGHLLRDLSLHVAILGACASDGAHSAPLDSGSCRHGAAEAGTNATPTDQESGAARRMLHRPAQPSVWSLSNHTVKPGTR